MPGRTIAVGDIHGCTAALKAILEAIDPQADDTIVTLGDYIDRGPDSRGTIDTLIELPSRCQLIPLLGNHDEMLLDIRAGRPGFDDWLSFGGGVTLMSYDCRLPEEIPQEHIDFLENCVDYHETDTHIFVHASYVPKLPMDDQPGLALRWDSLRNRPPGPHYSGKLVIAGHTSQKNGEILDLDHYLKCIDTYCYGDGWLTALDVHTGQLWQADKFGKMKSGG